MDAEEVILNPEVAARLLDADNLNLLRKIGKKKLLTKSERDRLESIARIGSEEGEGGANSEGNEYAKSKLKLCGELNLNRASLYRWMKREDFPKKESEGWNVEEVRQWVRKNYGGASPVKPSSGKYKDEQEKYKAERLRIQVGILNDEWMPVEIHLEVISKIVQGVKPVLQRLPSILAQQLFPENPAEGEAIILPFVSDAMRALGAIDVTPKDSSTKREKEAKMPTKIAPSKPKKKPNGG